MITTRPGAAILREAIVAILHERGPLTVREIRTELKARGLAGACVSTHAALRVLGRAADARETFGIWYTP